MIATIDPGKKHAGVALFEGGELATAWLSRGDNWLTTAHQAWLDIQKRVPSHVLNELAMEVPQIYTQTKSKGDPNKSLTPLILVVGGIAGHAPHCTVTLYLPREWKGQVDKDVMVERVKSKLSPEESSRIEYPRAKSLAHNVVDAIGIGLHHVRRERRRREGAAKGGDQLRAE